MVATASLRFIAYDSANVRMDGFYLAFTFYLYIFSLLLGSAEYKFIHVLKYIEFLTSNYGKGLFQLFIGILLFDNSSTQDIFASVFLSLIGLFNFVVGYIYILPEFDEPTPNFKEETKDVIEPKQEIKNDEESRPLVKKQMTNWEKKPLDIKEPVEESKEIK